MVSRNRRDLVVRITSDASKFSKGFKQAQGQVKSFGRQTQTASRQTANLGRTATGLGTQLSSLKGVATATGAVLAFKGIKDAVQRAEEMNSAYAITEQVIAQTGGAANVTAEEIKELSRQQSILTGIDKQLVTEGNNVLLTFKNVRNEVGEGNDVFNRASQLMLDVSATMGTDAKSAALQLGKALNDPVSQMGALSRAGLTFSTSQQQLIKDMVASGDLMGAQVMILEELESQLGGTAEASADATDKIANSWKEVQEAVGTALLEPLEEVTPTLTTIIPLIGEGLADAFRIAAESADPLIQLMTWLGDVTGETSDNTFTLGDAFDTLNDAANPVELLRNVWEGLAPAVETAGDAVGDFLNRNDANTDSMAESADKALLLSQGASSVGTQMDKAADQIHLANAAAKKAGTDGFPKARTGAKNMREEIEKAKEASRQLQLALLEAADPTFAAIRAAERRRDAEEALNDVRKDSKSTVEDVAEAEADLLAAIVEQEAAGIRLQDGGALASGLRIIEEGLDKDTESAIEFLNILGVLDGTSITTTVLTRFLTTTSAFADEPPAPPGFNPDIITYTTGDLTPPPVTPTGRPGHFPLPPSLTLNNTFNGTISDEGADQITNELIASGLTLTAESGAS